jgi:hypothetical protein
VEGPGAAFHQARDTEGAMGGCSSEWAVDQEDQEEGHNYVVLQVR